LLDNNRNFFTLAYFLEPQSPSVSDNPEKAQKVVPQNNLFVSSASSFCLSLRSETRYRCVSISFSRRWLLDVLQTNDTLQHLNEAVGEPGKLEVYQSIIPKERTILEDLFLSATNEQRFRSFYIKTVALQLVCDFLHRLKDEQSFMKMNSPQATPDEVEQWLCEHVTKEFPGTKVLAQQFTVSESTLKRHFKKKFGMTISAYLTGKKMQYAKELVAEQGLPFAEASRLVGYRSVQSFKEAFTNFHNGTPVQNKERKAWKKIFTPEQTQ
jgi:AraC-like DNA-binding protein